MVQSEGAGRGAIATPSTDWFWSAVTTSGTVNQSLDAVLEEGREEGREEGLLKGLRHNVEDLCELQGVELTAARRDVS